MNLCRSCNQDFGSVGAFDAHRVGVNAYTYPEGLQMEPMREDGRRCLTLEELDKHGFMRNERGSWSLRRDVERGRLLRHRESGQESASESLGGVDPA